MLLERIKNGAIGFVSIGIVTALAAYFGLPLLPDLTQRLTPEQLAALAGVLLAFVLEKLPVLSKWFGGLDPANKGAAHIGSVIGVGSALFGVSCTGRLGEGAAIVCNAAGAVGMVVLVLSALVTSLAAYLSLIKPKTAKK